MYLFPIDSRRGFTLIELSVVVVLLALVALVAVPRCAAMVRTARLTAAESDMRVLREAIISSDGGYVRDLGGLPGFSPAAIRIANLFMPTNVYGTRVNASAIHGAQMRMIRLDDDAAAELCRAEARALPQAFTTWDESLGRGWRGPYVKATVAVFPAAGDRRHPGDASFSERGFFPPTHNLRLPAVFGDSSVASVYGFAGEPAMFDPWGCPYVLQVPPPQAFPGVTNIADEVRFRYARIVSAGPDGVLSTPCFGGNATNWYATSWNELERRMSRQAGLFDVTNRVARGDDIVLFLMRNDVDEGEDSE